MADALHNIGETCIALGNYEEARGFFAASADSFHALHDDFAEGMSLVYLADAERDLGRHAEAEAHYEAALALFTKAHHDPRWEADALDGLANLRSLGGALDAAMYFFQAGLAIRRNCGDFEGEAATLIHIGHIHRVQHRIERSNEVLANSLQIARSHSLRAIEAKAHGELAMLCKDGGDDEAARVHFCECQDILTSITFDHLPRWESRLLQGSAVR